MLYSIYPKNELTCAILPKTDLLYAATWLMLFSSYCQRTALYFDGNFIALLFYGAANCSLSWNSMREKMMILSKYSMMRYPWIKSYPKYVSRYTKCISSSSLGLGFLGGCSRYAFISCYISFMFILN